MKEQVRLEDIIMWNVHKPSNIVSKYIIANSDIKSTHSHSYCKTSFLSETERPNWQKQNEENNERINHVIKRSGQIQHLITINWTK